MCWASIIPPSSLPKNHTTRHPFLRPPTQPDPKTPHSKKMIYPQITERDREKRGDFRGESQKKRKKYKSANRNTCDGKLKNTCKTRIFQITIRSLSFLEVELAYQHTAVDESPKSLKIGLVVWLLS